MDYTRVADLHVAMIGPIGQAYGLTPDDVTDAMLGGRNGLIDIPCGRRFREGAGVLALHASTIARVWTREAQAARDDIAAGAYA